MQRRDILPLAVTAVAGTTAPAAASTPLVAVLVLRIKPGRAAEFVDLLAPVLDAMRQEPTFINAVLHRAPEDPAHFMLYETWADRTDLVEVQMTRPYRAAYWARLPDLLAEPRQVRVWQPMRMDLAASR